MKIFRLSSCIVLILNMILVFSANAAETAYSVPTPMLEKIGKDQFKDHDGRVIFYPCSMGGEPLVIYSSVDGKPISSKSTITPVYLKNGYQASPIIITEPDMSEAVSNKDLIVQMINPAMDFMSIELTRLDGGSFYVDTANFPVVNTIKNAEGTLQKFVSIYNVSINNSSEEYVHTHFPSYNYSFFESAGLFVYHDVTQITANVASWNQNTKWTDGRLGRNLSNVPYRFSPIRVFNAGKIYNDGYGFWICGSDAKQDDHKKGEQDSYIDKAHE